MRYSTNWYQTALSIRIPISYGDASTTINNVFTSFPSIGERSFVRYSYTIKSAVSFTSNAKYVFSTGFYRGYRSQSRRADLVYKNTKTDMTSGEALGRIMYFNSNGARKSGGVILGNLDYTHTCNNKSFAVVSGLFEQGDLDGLKTNLNLSEPDRVQFR